MSPADVLETLADVERLVDRAAIDELAPRARGLAPHEAVWLLERLAVREQALVYRLLPRDVALTVFESLDPAQQGDLVGALQDEEVAGLFAHLDPDDRAELLDELPASVSSRLLQGLPPEERQLTAIVLGYPEDSIGRRMSPEIIPVRQELTAEQALLHVRVREARAETIYTLPVVDDERRLVGTLDLRDLLTAEPHTPVTSLARRTDHARVDETAETVARRCADQRLLAMPVVDSEHRLVGILTVDDALAVLEEADSEDQARMSGTEPLRRPYLATPIWSVVRARVVWLLVLAVGATLTVQVLEIFESTIEQMVVLSLFVPLLIGTGGNTGNQAATTVTGALALGDVGTRDILRVAAREVRVGATLGFLLGGLGFLVASAFYGVPIGTVIGLTLWSICTLAATVGGAMPIVGKLLRVDPAVFANPFITTLVDAAGLILYFLIARSLLGL